MREAQPYSQTGLLLRVLRKRKGLTLEQLANEVGLSKGHLSRYERGEKALSVSSLMRLAKVLDSSVSALLGELPQTDLVHMVRTIDRPTAQSAPTREGSYKFIPLSRPGDARSTVLIAQLSNNSVATGDAYHEGEEMLFVLTGSVELEMNGRVGLLRQGDFLQFPGTERHRLTGKEEGTEVLIVVTDIGDNRAKGE